MVFWGFFCLWIVWCGIKMVFNLKLKWWKIFGDGNDGLFVRNVLIFDVEFELCVKFLEILLFKNFLGFWVCLEKVNKEWLNEFLNFGGMSCLLDGFLFLLFGDR